MVVGVLTVDLFMGEAGSLKEKRKILRSLLDRIRNRFHVSAAEVGAQDTWKRSTIGIACVSCELSHASQVLAAVVNFIERQGTVLIIDYQTELL